MIIVDISISKKRIYSFIVVIILILNENIFYLLPNNPYWKLLSILLCVILFGSKVSISAQYKSIFNFVTCFILVGLISQLYTVFGNLQSVPQAYVKYQSIWLIVACIPFLNNSSRFGKRTVRNAIEVVVTVMSFVYICQSLLYPKYIFITAGLSLRNGDMRTVVGSTIFAIGFLLLLGDMLAVRRGKERLKYITAAIIVGYNIIVIIQTRSLNFALIAAIFFLMLRTINAKNFRGKEKLLWQLFMGALAMGIIIWGIGYFYEIIGASLENNESSTVNRLGGYQYYFQLFLLHPLLGIGMIRNQAVDGLAQVGVAMKYYIDDIGFVGYLAQYGVIGLLCFFIWLRTLFIYLRQNGDNAYWSIFVFLILLLPFNSLLNMDVGVLYIAFLFVMIAKE